MTSETSGADELVHPQLAGDVDGGRRQLDPPHALGLRAVHDALELDDPAVLKSAGVLDGEGAAGCGEDRPRIEPLGQVGPELDDDLAAQAVGLGDPADGEQIRRGLSRRRCRRWPARRPWPRPR